MSVVRSGLNSISLACHTHQALVTKVSKLSEVTAISSIGCRGPGQTGTLTRPAEHWCYRFKVQFKKIFLLTVPRVQFLAVTIHGPDMNVPYLKTGIWKLKLSMEIFCTVPFFDHLTMTYFHFYWKQFHLNRAISTFTGSSFT